MSQLPPPLKVSPIIKILRYGSLTAGILFGATRRKALEQYEISMKDERAQEKAERDKALYEDKMAKARADRAEFYKIIDSLGIPDDAKLDKEPEAVDTSRHLRRDEAPLGLLQLPKIYSPLDQEERRGGIAEEEQDEIKSARFQIEVHKRIPVRPPGPLVGLAPGVEIQQQPQQPPSTASAPQPSQPAQSEQPRPPLPQAQGSALSQAPTQFAAGTTVKIKEATPAGDKSTQIKTEVSIDSITTEDLGKPNMDQQKKEDA